MPSAQDSRPASGKHFVGVKPRVQIKASSTTKTMWTMKLQLSFPGGETLHADDNPIADCSNFDNGQIRLKGGAAGAGCRTFQVPKGQQVVRVGYGNMVFPGNTAEWRTS